MLAGRIVEHLDVFEHIPACLVARAVDLAADTLALEQVEDALGDSVVMTVAATAHRALQIVVFQERSPSMLVNWLP